MIFYRLNFLGRIITFTHYESHRAEIIRSMQPYTTEDAMTSTLFVIHSLNIRDKHRLPILVAGAVAMPNEIAVGTTDGSPAVISWLSPPSLKKLTSEGVDILRIGLHNSNPSFYANANCVMQIAFQQIGRFECVPAIDNLNKMLKFTKKQISRFEAEF